MKIYSATIWIACLLPVASGYLVLTKEFNDNAVLAIFIAVLFPVASFFVYIGMSKPPQDERLRKIGITAATYACYFTIALMGFFIHLGHYGDRQFTLPRCSACSSSFWQEAGWQSAIA